MAFIFSVAVFIVSVSLCEGLTKQEEQILLKVFPGYSIKAIKETEGIIAKDTKNPVRIRLEVSRKYEFMGKKYSIMILAFPDFQ